VIALQKPGALHFRYRVGSMDSLVLKTWDRPKVEHYIFISSIFHLLMIMIMIMIVIMIMIMIVIINAEN
jgi:hypothetical protein